MRKRKADFAIHTGDMVLSGGKAEEWNKFFEIETPLLRDRCVRSVGLRFRGAWATWT